MMDEAQRARAEKIVEMWINGELATPHDGVRAIVAALAQARREGMETAATRVCEWIDGADAYETACGHAYWLACGTLTECEHRYCPWCGGRIAPQEEG